ncbi:MAG: FliA/WhiG family RNA polymerase sigma factor [Armatimonadetes bacterium]|nr:FliA/WhiG family RNA polymerase sigma factor [Armatimonadota bacterium]
MTASSVLARSGRMASVSMMIGRACDERGWLNMDVREKLWMAYKKDGSEEAREKLISEYAYLAKYAVDRLNLAPSGALSYEDLIGHAVVGLIDAIEKFDPSRNVKFETYALARIRGEVIDVIRALDWTPRSVRRQEADLRRAYARLEVDLRRPATDQEVADHLGISVADLERMLADVGQSALLSLEEIIANGGDVLASPDDNSLEDPAERAERAEQRRILARAVDELPERERTVIALYYYEGLTQKEIAAVLGVTESRVCQIHTKAVLRLSAKLTRTPAAYALAV